MSNYFGKDVDDAIVEFQTEKNIELKKKIFERKIASAFIKLCQYHYYRFPIRKNKDVIFECLAFLYEQVGKFDSSRYKRGFPYFNLITKHYFIQKLKNEKREVSIDKDFLSLNDAKVVEDEELMVDNIEIFAERKEFIELFKKQLIKWKDKFNKDHEKKLAEGLIHLFENADSIDIYQKKAVFFYLREITGLNSKQIAVNVNKIYRKFLNFKKRYEKGEI
jgi:DNA-directed RNA polymerase specialized sigma24 family protein